VKYLTQSGQSSALQVIDLQAYNLISRPERVKGDWNWKSRPKFALCDPL